MPTRTLAATAISLGLLLAACGGRTLVETTAIVFIPPPDEALGGDGLPVLNPNQPITHVSVPVQGAFDLRSNGCWIADLGDSFDRLVIFPVGYDKPPEDGAVMRGPDGTIVTDDMAFDGFGSVSPVSMLPGYPEGYWGGYVSFCEPDALEVLVLSELQAAFEPDALGAEAWADLVKQTEFTESWPCGIGFAISDRLQQVAVQLYATDTDVASESPVTFPSAGWTAQVVVGKHLMSNHCNDAIEGWTAERRETGRWEIVGGVLDFAPRVNDPCGGGNSVTGILRDGVVDTPVGRIDLPDLHIENRAFGCFAG